MGESQIQSGAKPDGVVMDILQGSALAGNQQSADEGQTVKMIAGILVAGKNWKATWGKNHDRWWNLWESNHYAGRRAHTLSQAIVNQVWSSLETFIAHITEGLPEPLVRARKVDFKDKAKAVQKWLVYETDRNDLGEQIEHAVRSACVTGAGWYAVEWDEKALGGRGDVSLLPIDEKFIFTSPNCRNLQEALYVIEAKNVPMDFILKTWPEKGQLVKPGTIDLSLNNERTYKELNNQDQASPNWLQATSTDGSQSSWMNSTQALGFKKSNLVTLVKAYIRQDDGSMRLAVMAGGVLLQDGQSPYDDDDYPYAVINILPTLDTIQGRGLVQFIEGLQYILNNSISYLLDQQRFSSDPMMIVDAENLEDGQLIDNSPGAVLPNASQREGYRWMQAPGFNQAWLQIQEIAKDYMDAVLGRVEILQGENPTGVSTLGGLEVLRDEANIRLRKHIKWVKASLKRIYLLTISRLRQFATGGRTVRLTGKYGEDQYVDINPTTGVNPDGSPFIDFTIPENAEFDVEFGKEVAGGLQAKIETALALAGTPAEDGLPMVTRKWVLDQAEIAEAPEIIQDMATLQQQQMMSQQQAAMTPEQQQAQQQPQGDPLDPLIEAMSGVKG